uniref:hypothetical protein n=1 Tax=Corallococcus coralloides TaxID=184914 RepID=UPI0013E8CC72|nr:hypothetical protein [Corallococcus coralloides]
MGTKERHGARAAQVVERIEAGPGFGIEAGEEVLLGGGVSLVSKCLDDLRPER